MRSTFILYQLRYIYIFALYIFCLFDNSSNSNDSKALSFLLATTSSSRSIKVVHILWHKSEKKEHVCKISFWLSQDSPGRRWGCRAGGGRVRCWRWCLHTRADRLWWSLWSPAGSSGAAGPSGPSLSAPSRYHSSSGTLTACIPGKHTNKTWRNRRERDLFTGQPIERVFFSCLLI